MGSGATPMWSMSRTALRASAAMRGSVTWSAIIRRVTRSGKPWFRERLPRSCRQASMLLSLLSADAGPS